MDSILGGLIESLIISLIIFLAIVLTLAITALGLYILVLLTKMQKREQKSLEMVTLEVRVPKDNEIKIDAAEQLFASFSGLGNSGFWSFLEVEDTIAFEMIGKRGEVAFMITVPNKLKDLVEKQIYAYYPICDIRLVEEPNIFSEHGKVAFVGLKLKNEDFKPMKPFKELPTDSLSLLTSPLSKMGENEGAVIQILIRATSSNYKKEGKSFVSSTKKKEATPDEAKFDVDQKDLERIIDKVTKPGFDVAINLVASAETKEMAELHLNNIKSAFNQHNGR